MLLKKLKNKLKKFVYLWLFAIINCNIAFVNSSETYRQVPRKAKKVVVRKRPSQLNSKRVPVKKKRKPAQGSTVGPTQRSTTSGSVTPSTATASTKKPILTPGTVASSSATCPSPVPEEITDCTVLANNQTKLNNLLKALQDSMADVSLYASKLTTSSLPLNYAVNMKTGKFETVLGDETNYSTLDQLFPKYFPGGKFNCLILDDFINFIKNPSGTAEQKAQIKSLFKNPDYMFETLFQNSCKTNAAMYAEKSEKFSTAQKNLMEEITNQGIKRIYNKLLVDNNGNPILDTKGQPQYVYDPTIIDAPHPTQEIVTIGKGLPDSQDIPIISNFNLINIAQLSNYINICIPNAITRLGKCPPPKPPEFTTSSIISLAMSGAILLVMAAPHLPNPFKAKPSKVGEKTVEPEGKGETPSDNSFNIQEDEEIFGLEKNKTLLDELKSKPSPPPEFETPPPPPADDMSFPTGVDEIPPPPPIEDMSFPTGADQIPPPPTEPAPTVEPGGGFTEGADTFGSEVEFTRSPIFD